MSLHRFLFLDATLSVHYQTQHWLLDVTYLNAISLSIYNWNFLIKGTCLCNCHNNNSLQTVWQIPELCKHYWIRMKLSKSLELWINTQKPVRMARRNFWQSHYQMQHRSYHMHWQSSFIVITMLCGVFL